MKYFLTLFLILICCNFIKSQITGTPNQTIINKLWQKNFGNPTNSDWSASILDVSGNLITTGNNVDSLGHIQLYLVKQNSSGVILWERSFTPANSSSYGIALVSDAGGNIYVAAATKGSNLKYDFLVLKYDPAGLKIWDKQFNGPGNGDDVPTGITYSGNSLFLTGLSEGINTLYDYWTLGLSTANGNINWSARYNFANLYDAPAFIKIDNLGFLIVTGVSASSSINWELATVKYSQTGQLISQNRVSNNGIGIFLPSWLDIDAVGNIYITGTHITNSANLDIKTVKINSNFTIGWQADFDSPSPIDSSTVVKADNLGNIIVSGYYKNTDGSKNGVLLKYSNSGSLIWKQVRAARSANSIVIPRRVEVDNTGNIIVAYEDIELNSSIIDLVQYDPLGNISWVQAIKLSENSINRPNAIILNNGHVYVSSLNKASTGNTYFTLRIDPFIHTISPSDYSQSRVKNEVIVRFAKGTTLSSFINDRNKKSGKIHDIINQNLISDIGNKLQANNFGDWDVIKVFPEMTEADSITNSYAGNQLHVPPFYNTFLLIIPRDYTRIVRETAIADTLLSKSLGCKIIGASANYFINSDCQPNDPLYLSGKQASLVAPPNSPDGSISVEDAWCVWQGSSDTKVVIADIGLQWSHEDFGDGTFGGSVVTSGKNYFTGGTMPSDFIPDSHGTQVASITGAISNNGIGVAGIAGGTGSADGVRLVCHVVLGLNFSILQLLPSIKDAVDVDLAQIYNISGGIDDLDDNSIRMLDEVLNYVNQKGLVVCASRGNGNSSVLHYPSCNDEALTISVSGTGIDGSKDNNTRNVLVDVCAPSVSDLVTVAKPSNTSNQTYGPFNGTSSSTPHVSGEAALMIGYYKSLGITVSPDDVETLIKRSSTDIGTPGFDQNSGFGRINAGNLMNMIEGPKCNIFHFGTKTQTYTREQSAIFPNNVLKLTLTTSFVDKDGKEFPAGEYIATINQFDFWINHNLPSNYNISSIWPRNSNSNLLPLYEQSAPPTPDFVFGKVFPKGGVELIDFDQNIAHFRGFKYHVSSLSCQNCQGWIPNAPNDPDFVEYSILACDISSDTKDVKNTSSIYIYPNPADEEINIDFADGGQHFTEVMCFDLAGRLLKKLEVSQNSNHYSLPIKELPSGVYILSFRGKDGVKCQKFVKD